MGAERKLPLLTYCLCGDQAIFLDVERDRYFALRDRENRLFHEHFGQASTAGPILPAAIAHAAKCQPLTAAAYDLERVMPRTKTSPVTAAMIITSYIWWSLSLKRRGLRLTLASRALRSRREPKPDSDARQRLARGFRAMGAIGGTSENCLPRSLALHSLLDGAGWPSSLVIGVKIGPFAAHCWVQDDDTVLNDSVERVREFTPILVLS